MQAGAVLVVLRVEHVGVVVQPRHDVASVERDEELEFDARLREELGNAPQQFLDALSGARRREDRLRLETAQHEPLVVVDEVALVEHHDLGEVTRVDLTDDVAHRRELARRVGVRSIDDVDDDVGIRYLFEGRTEGLDELMRKVAHEADGIRERICMAVGGGILADGGVEGGEERVLHEGTGPGDAIEQRGLARVRIAGDGDGRHRVAHAVGPLGLSRGLEALDLLAQSRHPRVDPAAVELDLGLTGAPRPHAVASSDLATGLAGHRFTPAAQSREQVLELGEFDLRLALPALRVLAEDIEDHRGAVDDLHLDDVLERAPLARGEFSVDDHGVRT